MCVFGLTRGTHQVCSHYDDDIWPLQDIVLLLVVCARVNHHYILPARLHCPHCCNTIARLLGNIRPPLDLPLVCHTPYNIGNNNIV